MKIQTFITGTFLLLLSSDQVQAFAKARNEEQNEAFTLPSLTKKRLVPKQNILAKNKQKITHDLNPVLESGLNDFQRELALAMKDLQGAFGFISDSEKVVDDDDHEDDGLIDGRYILIGVTLILINPLLFPFVIAFWIILYIMGLSKITQSPTSAPIGSTPVPTFSSPT